MKLAQGQVWKSGKNYYRIVKWARLAIEYKHMTDLEAGRGELHQVSKKEFCRLIRGAELIGPNDASVTDAQAPAAAQEPQSHTQPPAVQTPDQSE